MTDSTYPVCLIRKTTTSTLLDQVDNNEINHISVKKNYDFSSETVAESNKEWHAKYHWEGGKVTWWVYDGIGSTQSTLTTTSPLRSSGNCGKPCP